MADGCPAACELTTVRRVGAGRAAGASGFYVVLSVLSVVSMFPFIWTFVSSRKTVAELYQFPPSLWPTSPQFVENYVEIWTRVPFGRWLWNTAFVTVLSLIGTVISASLVAYSFARFRYPGRDFIFLVTLGTLMLPVEVTLIPQYLLFKDLGLARHVPAADRADLARRRRVQHLPDAPVHHDDPVRPRRGGPDRRRASWRVFWQILMPLCKPALATMATLGFITQWNNFLPPLIFISSESNYLVAVGLRYFASGVQGGQAAARPQDHLLMGAALMVALPCLFFSSWPRSTSSRES